MSYIAYVYWYYASDVVYFLGILFWHNSTQTHTHTKIHTHSAIYTCVLSLRAIKIRDITLRVAHVSHTKLYLMLPSHCLPTLCALANDKQIYIYTI